MKYIDTDTLKKAKSVGLLEYLQITDPARLVRINRDTYCLKDHDSLKISHGKWCWWSHGAIGGRSAIDFLVKVEGKSFIEAVWMVIDSHNIGIASQIGTQKKVYKVKQEKNLQLPVMRYPDDAIYYLRQRAIADDVIQFFVEANLLKETYDRKKCVFLGKDENGVYRYAALRAINGNWKGEAAGSNKKYSFRYISSAGDILHLFESAIDLLSYASLNDEWKNMDMLSLGGVTDSAKIPESLEHCMKLRKYKSVHLHLDNDEAGINAASQIGTRLKDEGYEVVDDMPEAKDVNEELMSRKRCIMS